MSSRDVLLLLALALLGVVAVASQDNQNFRLVATALELYVRGSSGWLDYTAGAVGYVWIYSESAGDYFPFCLPDGGNTTWDAGAASYACRAAGYDRGVQVATGNGTANRRVGFGSPLPQVQDLTCPEGAATAQLRDCRAAVLTEPTACVWEWQLWLSVRRQLGMTGGEALCCAAFGPAPASAPIMLDEVTCRGEEPALLLGGCMTGAWGSHDCDPGEAVAALVSGRNLSVTPPLRCIASGSHTTGTGCDPRFEPTYFFANNMFNDVVYRIVYVYLDGAHSCPSPLTVRAVSKLVQLDMVLPPGGDPVYLDPRVPGRLMLQRKGRISTGYQISPSWVDGVWLDASRYILDDGKTAVTWALDDAKGWLADRGVMQPAGPAVAGWRWKHGFVGNTDGYSPATFPELITTDGGAGGGGGGGINATYQLVYELDGGTHFLPHPTGARGLVVQRMEGDSLWNVAFLAVSSPAVQRRAFVVMDTTSRDTWGAVIADLPLSPGGPLLSCRGCMEVTLRRVQLRNLSAAAIAAGSAAMSQPPPEPPLMSYGAVLLHGARAATLEDVACTDAAGQLLAATAKGSSGAAGGAPPPQGAGAVAVIILLNTPAAAAAAGSSIGGSSTGGSIQQAVFVNIADSRFDRNEGVLGAVLFTGPNMTTWLSASNSSFNSNHAAFRGGVVALAGPAAEVHFTSGSMVVNNSATQGGGVVNSVTDIQAFRLTGGCSVLGNTPGEGGYGGVLNAETYLDIVDFINVTVSGNGGSSISSYGSVIKADPTLASSVPWDYDRLGGQHTGANITILNSRVTNNGGAWVFLFGLFNMIEVRASDMSRNNGLWFSPWRGDQSSNPRAALLGFHLQEGTRVCGNIAPAYQGLAPVLYTAVPVGRVEINNTTVCSNYGRDASAFGSVASIKSVVITNGSHIYNNSIGARASMKPTILATGESGAVHVANDVGSISILGGATLSHNRAARGKGGAISVGGQVTGDVRVAGGSSAEHNEAGAGAGGFLFVNGAILGGLFVEGGSSVRQNTAATSGGAVHAGGGIFGGVRVAGVGSRLCNNSATTSNGGAVSAGPAMASLEVADGAAGDVSSVRAVNGSTVSGNTATLEGGVLLASLLGGLELLSGAVMSRNVAGGNGGAVFADRIRMLGVSDSIVEGNQAGGSGGFVAAGTLIDTVSFARARVSRNVAEQGPGGVLSLSIPPPGSQLLVDVSGSSFLNNYAGGAGGALSLSAPAAGAIDLAVAVRDCAFAGNSAGSELFLLGSSLYSGYGGSIALVSLPKLRADLAHAILQLQRARSVWLDVSGSTFTNNLAEADCGGALHAETAHAAGVRLHDVTVRGNQAAEGGGLCLSARGSAAAALVSGSRLSDNAAAGGGGAVLAKLSGGANNTLELVDCTVYGNRATSGAGAAVVSGGRGSQLVVSGSSVEANLATVSGGGAHVQCDATAAAAAATAGEARCGPEPLLVLRNASLSHNAAASASRSYEGRGGGVFVGPGASASLQGLAMTSNVAGEAGGAVAAEECEALVLEGCNVTDGQAARFGAGLFVRSCGSTVAHGVRLVNNTALTGGACFFAGPTADAGILRLVSASGGTTATTTAVVDGTVSTASRGGSVVLRGCVLAGNAAASSAREDSSSLGLQRTYFRYSGHGGAAALLAKAGQEEGCWRLALSDLRLPSSQAYPLWMQDERARSLQAGCSLGDASASDSSADTTSSTGTILALTSAACNSSSAAVPPSLQHACEQMATLRGCSARVAAAAARSGSSSGNSTLSLSEGPGGPPSERPWHDPRLAVLDPDAASGGSLSVEVVEGVAVWPRLTVRGWVGAYVLVFRAISSLEVAVEVEPCAPGEALDLSWARQSWGRPSWVACAACAPGQFTVWRDARPPQWRVDGSDYVDVMKALSEAAAAGEAKCMACPDRATCPGGAVVVPKPGYWHSGPDSPKLHRCPFQPACGNPAGSVPRCGVVGAFGGSGASPTAHAASSRKLALLSRRDELCAADILKVLIVHVQYYVIITRLPVSYPGSINALAAILNAITGASSAIVFSYSCLVPGQDSWEQALSQLLGSLITPLVIIAVSMSIWAASGAAYSYGTGGGTAHGASSKRRISAVNSSSRHHQPTLLPSRLSNATRLPSKALSRVQSSVSSRYAASALRRTLTQVDGAVSLPEQLWVVALVGVFIMYPGWANASLSVFTCYHIDPQPAAAQRAAEPFWDRYRATWQYGYWIRNMQQECYSGEHLAAAVPIGVVAVCLFLIFPPLLSFLLLWRHRRALGEPDVAKLFGFMYNRYKPLFWWWGSALMLQQLLLVAVEAFGRALGNVMQQVRAHVMAGDSEAQLSASAQDAVGGIIIAINLALLAAFVALLLRRTWVWARGRLDDRMAALRQRYAAVRRRHLLPDTEASHHVNVHEDGTEGAAVPASQGAQQRGFPAPVHRAMAFAGNACSV
eukprot:XP_001692355.1 predicted protein [Chlamydomonas reinhardtii]